MIYNKNTDIKMNKEPSPFSDFDSFVCGCFAYAYTIGFTNLNVAMLILTELCWMWYCRQRVKR